MSREPALTFEGALRILGRKEHKWLDRLNVLLGGAILTAGALTPGIAPAAVLGWIEPKNDAVKLLRKALDALPDRLRGTAGLERRELIIAAHSTIVVAAYFETVQELLGDATYRSFELTDEEKRLLVAKTTQKLYLSDIPAPSAASGVYETLDWLPRWYADLTVHVERFLHGLSRGEGVTLGNLPLHTVARYESHFLKLAATVPEFRVWAELTEHAATRSKLDAAQGETRDLFTGQAEALARVESILTRMNPAAASLATADKCAAVAAANRAALDEMIIPEAAARDYGRHLVFPKVRQIFVNPRYRFGLAAESVCLTSDSWWRDQPIEDNLDLRLIAHITSAQSASLPLLVLGHPGAGKSMLTRVLAARLPQSAYTVVRVPLRHVGAHSPVFRQIQDALDRITNSRVEWSELVDQSVDKVRIVILDGLDELLHQAQSGLYGYLREVQEFQRNELNQGRPVVVIVTSRTMVADRVDVPELTPVIKLEEFDDGQIDRWLDAWNEANAPGISAGTTRALEREIAREQRDLTAQPLLLMMMAIYVADPKVPVIDEKISTADLYERLLTHFAEREAAKSPTALPQEEIRRNVEYQLRHLSIAALGMFNRGRQDISAEELGTDLTALEKVTGNAADAGHEVLGKFFFIYVAEARFQKPDAPDRRYEFLHATFGEYLVARLVVDELAEVARAAFSSRHGMREPEDDLLFALLSSEALSTRLPTLTFAEARCAQLDEDREQIVKMLNTLLAGHRDRHGSDKYKDYRPKPVDRVRELAAYTANLVLLRHAFDPQWQVPLRELFPDAADPERPWRAMLSLWRAGLNDEAWNGLIDVLRYDDGHLRLTENSSPTPARVNAYFAARLGGDRHLVDALRYGYAFTDNWLFGALNDGWMEANGPWLAASLANRHLGVNMLVNEPPEDADINDVASFRAELAMLLKTRATHMSIGQVKEITTLLVDDDQPDSVALACAVMAYPDLLAQVPGLDDPELFATPQAELLLRAFLPPRVAEPEPLERLRRDVRRRSSLDQIPGSVLAAVREIVFAYRWPDLLPDLEFPSLADDDQDP
ncbi:ATP-binding protein [Catenulispora subtropica]|uniref:AAA+ ATPase domain-containing protein n=1 Tax=Catenulispora subtropica TaxID=450798 RepID=A0ABP5DLS9_9ACTN